MIGTLRKLTWPFPRRQQPSMPPGERAYAVGDIHGQMNLFAALIEAIDRDDAERSEARTTVVLLGDLVDRGPASAQVVEAARGWSERREVRILCGNHEEMFLRAFEDEDVFRRFLYFGGQETLMSYLPDPEVLDTIDMGEAHALWQASVPPAHVEFIAAFEDSLAIGDYLFVHAGIRPGIALDEQSPADLRWIREPFLGSRKRHGHVVVHGHTIVREPVIRRNRIGIDTGAYRSGRLTALGLEGTARWLIEAREDENGVVVDTRAVD